MTPSSVSLLTTLSYCSAVNEGGAKRMSTLKMFLSFAGESLTLLPSQRERSARIALRGCAFADVQKRTHLRGLLAPSARSVRWSLISGGAQVRERRPTGAGAVIGRA